MSGYVRTEYSQRPFVNPQSINVARLMETKKSNICLAADVKSMAELIKLAEKVGEHIVLLKTHIDTYEDFSHENVKTLQALAKMHNFIIFEDRKFCDIGNTVKEQYTSGIYKIAEWSPITNLLIASGPGVIDALKEGVVKTAKIVPEVADNAFLLLAEMSSKNNNFTFFLKETIQAAVDHQDKVMGFIAQRSFGNPSFLYMTPGVNAIQKNDSLDQTYRTPEEVINTGADVLIIGRGIYESKDGDPVKAAKAYQEAGWKAHMAALNTFIKVPEDISAFGIKSKTYQEEFIETLLDARALSFGSFTLKSGRISPYFCNCGELTSGKDIAKAGEALAHAINNSKVDYDVLFGPAYKGIPFVTAAAVGLNTLFNRNVDFAFNRKEAKDHGEGGNLVGCSLAGKKVFIIDDVITAGTAIKESIDIIRKAGGIAVGAAVLLDREEKAGQSDLSAIQQVQKDYGINIVSAIKCQDLFKFAKNSEDFKIFAGDMEKYHLQYGI